jgi:hypothetical protein
MEGQEDTPARKPASDAALRTSMELLLWSQSPLAGMCCPAAHEIPRGFGWAEQPEEAEQSATSAVKKNQTGPQDIDRVTFPLRHSDHLAIAVETQRH